MLDGAFAPIADLAGSVPRPSKNPIGDVKASVPSGGENFLLHLGGRAPYSGHQNGVVKRLAKPGCRVRCRMQISEDALKELDYGIDR